MNYKESLNLPRTGFPMKANLANLEPKIISYWEELDIYKKLRQTRKGRKHFILHDGPPYANGPIHIGHALNKILKDIVIKYKFLNGHDCPFIIGWDCHGLPVEHQLFKKLKASKHDVEVLDFRRKARDYALEFVDLQRDDFIKLGVFSDWERPYLTLKPEYEYGVMKLLEYLISDNYIYRGRKPVNWCSSCETALAEAEVEYAEKESESIYFLFEALENRDEVSYPSKFSLLVWTTTPWTVVSNVAVAVHPDMDYSVVESRGKAFVCLRDLIPLLEDRLGKPFKIASTFKGSVLEGVKLKHPFLERVVPVVLADFVSCEEGSGCVHIAPGHGQEDFSLVRKYNLEIIMPVNDKGFFQEPLTFKGKNIGEANDTVINELKERGALLEHSKIRHSYPHCWRCKKPIIFRATFQWFLNVDHNGLRSRLLKEAEGVKWIPPAGKERMQGMLRLRPDWCLSRQRLWGVPIPAVKCRECGEVVLSKEVAGRTADVFSRKGSDSWFSEELGSFTPEDLECPNCKGKHFDKEFDILDVWFESGASFFSVVKSNPDLTFPADLYLEGSDQHRGWFQVSLIPSVAKEGKAPFKNILTHGFVVDGEGRKMSKSAGNVIAPQKISRQYGSEILRLWAAYTDYREDVKISQDILKQLVEMYRKVRNTIRFVLGNISDFDYARDTVELKDVFEVDRLMLARVNILFEKCIGFYEEFSFYKVCQCIFNFCNLDLSSFYLDILKDRLYTFSQKSKERLSAQFALSYILNILLKLMAPILSFTAEEAYGCWDNLKSKRESIFIAELSEEFDGRLSDKSLVDEWERIFALRSKVLKELEKEREKANIGSSLEAAVALRLEGKDFKLLKGREDMLKEIFITSAVSLEEGSFEISVGKAKGNKCMRCWNWSETVGGDKDNPQICSKCTAALKEGNDEA